MSLQPGQRLELEADDLDDEGAGLGQAGGVALHLRGALPGERVRAEVEHVSPHAGGGGPPPPGKPGRGPRAWGRTLQVLAASPDRREPACPAYGACGGCPLQHLAYERQLAWKTRQVERALATVPGLAQVGVDACLPSPRPLGYRNQAKYVYGQPAPGSPVVLGAYAPRSHRLVDLAGCRVVEPPIDHVAAQLRDILERRQVVPFDERRRTGVLRYVLLRSNAAGQVLATLIAARPLPDGETLAAELCAAAPEIAGVVQSQNALAGNALFAPPAADAPDRVLAGAGQLTECLNGVPVPIGPRSFLQLNRQVAARAYDAVRAFAGGRGALARIVDVYAGVGAVAFHLADLAAAITAIEENPAAAAAGAQAAAGAGLRHLQFVAADAEQPTTLGGQLSGADLVVLNPPRAGAAAAAAAIAAAAPPVSALAYLSCNPLSLARDLQVLTAAGLQIRRVQPLDMLPHTAHIETLVTLERGQQP